MSTQGAEFVRSGRKRLPFWQKTPDAGTKRQVQSLPLSARFWKRAGSRAHQGSGKRQTPAPDASATLDGALFNKALIIDSFSKDVEMQSCKRAAGHSLSSGMEKGIITDFAKKARSQLIKEGNFMAARALDFLVCGAINEPHLPADGSISEQFFLCSLRPENLGHQEA